MTIPETQLETWTHIGAAQQSSATYQSIKAVIEQRESPYATRTIDSFLQGSYGNDTNVYGVDSDVDIVLRCKSFFHYNIDALSEAEKNEFRRIHSNVAEYTLTNFTSEVIAWLTTNYGDNLDTSGKKALRISGSGSRRDADILLVAPHKKYTRYVDNGNCDYVEGVLFMTTGGVSIINYPKQHSENMTFRHQATNQWLKPTVRIFKNIRNRLVRDGAIKSGSAPSYFIEGMLHNVPMDHFGANYQKTVEKCWAWINAANADSLLCANGQHPLVRDNTHTSWSAQDCKGFLVQIASLWNRWGA